VYVGRGSGLEGLKGYLSRRLLRKLAPKKTQFAAVDIGSKEIKIVEIDV